MCFEIVNFSILMLPKMTAVLARPRVGDLVQHIAAPARLKTAHSSEAWWFPVATPALPWRVGEAGMREFCDYKLGFKLAGGRRQEQVIPLLRVGIGDFPSSALSFKEKQNTDLLKAVTHGFYA